MLVERILSNQLIVFYKAFDIQQAMSSTAASCQASLLVESAGYFGCSCQKMLLRLKHEEPEDRQVQNYQLPITRVKSPPANCAYIVESQLTLGFVFNALSLLWSMNFLTTALSSSLAPPRNSRRMLGSRNIFFKAFERRSIVRRMRLNACASGCQRPAAIETVSIHSSKIWSSQT